MKQVILLIVLIAGVNVAIYYGGCYVSGGIEAGLPGGGHGKFKQYHEGNIITEFFKGSRGSSYSSTPFSAGELSTNPYLQNAGPESSSEESSLP